MKKPIAAVLLLAFVLPACKGSTRKPAVTDPGGTVAQPSPTPEATPYPESTPPPPEEDFKPIDTGTITAWDPTTPEGQSLLADVYFGYDSASLDDAARAVLEKHALWLQNQRDAKLVIEGHCDERGTVEYNLALGEQRARAAFDYLKNLGVSADRMRIVSFGKEKPLDLGHDESAWARNRRAHFALTR